MSERTLRADGQGFLVGQASNLDVAGYVRQLQVMRSMERHLGQIAGDTAALRRVLERPAVPQAPRTGNPAATSRAAGPRLPAAANDHQRASSSAATPVAAQRNAERADNSKAQAPARPRAEASRPAARGADKPQRDSSGRFIAAGRTVVTPGDGRRHQEEPAEAERAPAAAGGSLLDGAARKLEDAAQSLKVSVGELGQERPAVPQAPRTGNHGAMPVAAQRNAERADNSKAQASAQPRAETSRPAAREADKPQRDSSGRFIAAGRTVVTPGDGRRHQEEQAEAERAPAAAGGSLLEGAARKLGDAAQSLKASVGELGQGTDQIDPVLAATKEASSILAPIGRLGKGLVRSIFTRRDKGDEVVKQSVPWYRRIWGELRGINQKSGGRSGMGMLLGLLGTLGSVLGGLLGLLRRLPGAGLLGSAARAAGSLLGRRRRGGRLEGRSRSRRAEARERLRARRARQAGEGAGEPLKRRGGGEVGGDLLKRGKGAVAGAGRSLGRLAKGFLRRVPLLGGLLAGGQAVASLFGDDDPNLSPEENRKNRFGGVGGGVGALVGGGLGALVGGPVGAVVGGMLGDMLGTKVGEWLSTVDWKAVGQTMTDAWSTASDYVSKLWDGVGDTWTTASGWISDKWKGALDQLDGVMKGLSGAVDKATAWIGEKAESAKAWVGDKVQGARDWVTEKGEAVTQKASDVAGVVTDSARRGYQALTGTTADRKRGLVEAMNGSGIKDPREQAMFMAQMDHESAGFSKLEEGFNYRSADRIMSVSGTARKQGKEAVQAAMDKGPEAVAELMYGGRMGNTEAGDGYRYRGRGFVQLTGRSNYAEASQALGLDLVGNPDLAKDPEVAGKVAAWYWKRRGLASAGQAGDVEGATRLINGGTNGLDDRQAKYAAYLTQAQAGELTLQTGNDTRAPVPAAVGQSIASTTAAIKGATATPAPLVLARSAGAAAPAAVPSPGAGPSVDLSLPRPAEGVKVPLASTRKPAPVIAKLADHVGQDLGDRSIAHLATGGLAGN